MCWKSAYGARLGRDLGHVQLVADVRVQVHALGGDGLDRLARELERDRHVAEERPVGVRDDRALVADDRVVEPGLGEVARDRAVHAAGDDHDVDAGRPRAAERGARPRAQDGVGGDERAVEVAGERLDVVGERGREPQLPATLET